MPSGAKKRKAARKKLKYGNSSSSQGRDIPKPVGERGSGIGGLESLKEEVCEEEGVGVEVGAKPLEDGVGGADLYSVDATAKGVGVGVGVSVEELQKSVEGISDNGLVKEVATLAQEVGPAGEKLVISDVVGLELIKNADAFSPILDDKKLLPTVGDGELGKVGTHAVSVGKGESLGATTSAASHVVGVVENGDSHVHSSDSLGSTVSKTCRDDCSKNDLKLETQKQSEQQALIGVNRPPVKRTSWLGCCGLFEVFTGADR